MDTLSDYNYFVIAGTHADVEASAYFGHARNTGTSDLPGNAIIIDDIANTQTYSGAINPVYSILKDDLSALKAVDYGAGFCSSIDSVIIEVNDPTNVSGIDTSLPNPSFAAANTPSEILDAVANFKDSTVSYYA